MMIKTRSNMLRWVLSATLVALTTGTGCRKDKDSQEVLSLEGKVEKVTIRSRDAGEVAVRYYSEKHQQELIGKGEVTRDTEILINGVVSTLQDIREGEQIRGEVRVEKKDGQKRLIALKIIIDRPRSPAGPDG